jgi:hypothetical protein
VIETQAASISARLAAAILEWLDGAGQLPPETDLCLIYRVRGLDAAELPDEIVISGERRWRLAAVDGDFALRVALVDAATVPLVAFTPFSEEHFQADLRERAALRRVIRPLARHVLAALIARDASALDDDRFSGPLAACSMPGGAISCSMPPDVARGARRSARPMPWRSSAPRRSISTIYVERAAGELWQRWIVDPPLVNAALLASADETLRRRYPLYLKVLDAPPHDARAAFLLAARHDSTADPAVRQLALDTARRLLVEQRALLDTLLRPVEAAYVAAGSPAIDSWMLAGAYAAQVRRLVQRCSTDEPPTTTAIGALEGFVYERRAERAALVRLARSSRGLRALETRALPVKLEAYAAAWRDDFTWLDRAARRLRESHVEDAEAARAVASVLGRWYALRDRWNAAFAKQLTIEWPALFKTPGRDAPLVVSHVLKHVVRPELPHKRTFLIVLYGCDMPTFLEIVEAFAGVGVTRSVSRLRYPRFRPSRVTPAGRFSVERSRMTACATSIARPTRTTTERRSRVPTSFSATSRDGCSSKAIWATPASHSSTPCNIRKVRRNSWRRYLTMSTTRSAAKSTACSPSAVSIAARRRFARRCSPRRTPAGASSSRPTTAILLIVSPT